MSGVKYIAHLSSTQVLGKTYELKYLLEMEDGSRVDVTDTYLAGDERYCRVKWVVVVSESLCGADIELLSRSDFRSKTKRRMLINGVDYNVICSVVTGNREGIVYRANMTISNQNDTFIYNEYHDGRYEVVVHPLLVDFSLTQ